MDDFRRGLRFVPSCPGKGGPFELMNIADKLFNSHTGKSGSDCKVRILKHSLYKQRIVVRLS